MSNQQCPLAGQTLRVQHVEQITPPVFEQKEHPFHGNGPSIFLEGSDGATYTTDSLAGSPYVLYFYPKDNTPGCTTEACDFRDNMARIESAGVKVLGVSPDSIKSHHKFIDKFELPFVLLSDPDHSLAESLGAWGPKKFMGKEYDGIIRSTFLVNGDGEIVQEWKKVKVKGHVDAVIEAINSHRCRRRQKRGKHESIAALAFPSVRPHG